MDNPAAAFTRDSAEGVMNDCTDDTDEDRDTDKDGGSQCSLLFLRTLIPDGSDHQAACKSLVSICVFAAVAPGGSSDLWVLDTTRSLR